VILEWNQFKAAITYALKNTFFQEKPIWIGNQSQSGHLGGEFP
jgi:hypothetical protein